MSFGLVYFLCLLIANSWENFFNKIAFGLYYIVYSEAREEGGEKEMGKTCSKGFGARLKPRGLCGHLLTHWGSKRNNMDNRFKMIKKINFFVPTEALGGQFL